MKSILWEDKSGKHIEADSMQNKNGNWTVITKSDNQTIIVPNDVYQAVQNRIGEEHGNMWEDAFEDGRYFIEEDDYDYINNFVKVSD